MALGTSTRVKFSFDSCNVTVVILVFYTSLHFDTKILDIRKVVLREQDENESPRTSGKVECDPLATVSTTQAPRYTTSACIFNWLKKTVVNWLLTF